MMPYTNLHLHTTYCDGKHDPETMVLAALEAGCRGIGFSAHAYFPQDDAWTLQKDEGERAYRKEVMVLRKRYGDRIAIYLGLEQDVDAPLSVYDYDYIIGATHGFFKNGDYIYADYSPEMVDQALTKHYGGDIYALCADYYEKVRHIATLPKLDIVAHLDLITKFEAVRARIDPEAPRYRQAWKAAVEELLPTGALFEINTGAMTRGYQTKPYPSQEMLRYISACGGRIILTGDTHSKEHVVTFQDVAREWALEAGFKTHVQLIDGQWMELPL